MKVAIIGYSGSGKSSLAGYLSNIYNVPVLYLDTVYWLSGWIERKTDDSVLIVENFLNRNVEWVIDGNYKKLSYKRRLKEADIIIFMDFNRIICLFRALKRFFKYRGKTRESITKGCFEKLDFEFIKWILYKGRTHKKREDYKSVMKEYKDKIIVIKNQKQLDLYKLGLA